MDYFKSRHTVRQYSEQAPDKSLIKEIVEAACHAPTTGNMQLYSVIETRDAEMLKKLSAAHFNQPAAASAPVMLTVCADTKRFERWCEVSNAEPAFRNLQMLLAAIIDAVALTQQIVTIAEMRSLGTCYLGTVTYNAPQIAEILELPDGVVPITCLSVGYPQEGEVVKSERLEVDAVLYSERYPKFSNEEIKELYKAKDDYEPNQKFIADNGKQTLAQVFTDVRYPGANNEHFSEVLKGYLAKAGFML
jgi:nitroreductase